MHDTLARNNYFQQNYAPLIAVHYHKMNSEFLEEFLINFREFFLYSH